MKADYKTIQGLHPYRLKPNADNPREVAFAKAWNSEYTDILMHLMSVPCEPTDAGAIRDWMCGYIKHPIGKPTRRDRIIAATVIQWLGSNVGISFLKGVLRECGYGLKYPYEMKKS